MSDSTTNAGSSGAGAYTYREQNVDILFPFEPCEL
jgi:hypothetical protein